tara:strand:+ start:906 stop:1127 length:222 start_codon:yes stop_codon:yes gene_type:complete
MSIKNTDVVFKILTNKDVKNKTVRGRTYFKLSGFTVTMPSKLANKILNLLKKKRLNTIIEILGLHKDLIKTNF